MQPFRKEGCSNMEMYTPDPIQVQEVKTSRIPKAFSMGKTFLWMGFGLLISAIVSLVLPYILELFTPQQQDAAFITMYVIAIVCIIPCSFIAAQKAFSNKTVGVTIAYTIYAIAIGMLLSTIFIQFLQAFGESAVSIVAISFFVTAGCFFLMGGMGMLVKNMHKAIPFVTALLMGVLVLSLFNFFMGFEWVYWVVDLVLFLAILLYTAIDLSRIKKMVQSEALSECRSLAIYSGFVLYVDFVNIFLRVLYYVAILFMSKRD